MEQEGTPTPEPQPPEPENTPEASQKAEKDWSFEKICKVCSEDLVNREPKLMPCLHTVCKECVLNVTSADKPGCRCPICRQDCRNISDLIDNYFITNSNGASSSESKVKDNNFCLCDDKSEVSAFCEDCSEWLCEPCVQAHQRVRVTKDHVIKQRSDVAGTSGEGNGGGGRTEQRPLFCSVHRQEQLKLYCETCEKLTCRDCQLQEHKEHKYQFVGEIAARQKSALKVLLGKLGEKQNYVQQTKKHILAKGEQLQTNEQRTTQEIRNLVFRLVNDITQRGKKLLNDLKGVCDARRKMFDQQILEVHRVEQAIEHAVDFTQRALHSENITALLYSQKVIVHQLVFLLRIMCTRQPIAGLDIKFLANMQHMPNFSQLWTLVVHDPLQGNNSGGGAASQSGPTLSGPIPGPGLSGGQVPPELLVGGRMRAPGVRMTMSSQELQQKINLHQLMSRRQTTGEGSHHSPQGRGVEPGPRAFHQGPGVPPPLSGGHPPQGMSNQPVYRPIFPRNPSPMSYRPGLPPKYSYPPPNITINQMSKQMLSQVGINTTETIPNIPPIIPPRPSSEHSQSQSLSRSNTPSSPLLVSPASSNDETQQGNGARIKEESPREERASCSVMENQQRLNNNLSPQSMSSVASSQAEGNQAGRARSSNSEVTNSSPVPSAKDESGLSSCMMGNTDPIRIKQEPGLQEEEEEEVPLPVVHPTCEGQENGGKHMSPRAQNNSDPNEDWCAVCHNGGDLLCCDSCPRVYHLYCHIPALSNTPSDTWSCTLCQCPDQMTIARSLSPSSGRKRRISSALPEREKILCEKVLLEIYCSEDSISFQDPVSRSVPNYHKIIQHPMELGTMRSRLQSSHFNHYQTVLEFVDDFKLMIQNCHIYNGEESDIGRIASGLSQNFDELIIQHLPEYNHLLEGNVPSEGSLLALPPRPASAGEDGERRRKRKPDKVYHHIRTPTPPPVHIK